MNVIDEPAWIAFQTHVRESGHVGMKRLLEIFMQWSEAVEEYHDVSLYNHALTELEACSALSALDITELFVMASQFWPNGADFVDELSPLEMKMVQENITMKLVAQAEQARKAGERANQGGTPDTGV